jgi:Na+/H+-dicarboxylate symporter/ABC-type amino acid transport substrate-binding protein
MRELLKDQPISPAKSAGVTLPEWILAGAILGIAAGLIFGERTAILQPIGDAYGAMLQIAVYPYLLCSLMYGLGRLTPVTARRLLQAGWLPFLFLWILTLASIWILAHAIPPSPPPLSLTAAALRGRLGLMQLLIPSNLFAALRKNYVPAVVVFAIIYGVAFQGVQQKQTLLEIFDAVKTASVKIWGWIVKLAPFGVFALLAATAGTVRSDRLAGMVLYVVIYLLGAGILGLIVVPFLVSALVPEGYLDIVRRLRPAIVLAVVTTLSVVALPFVQRAVESALDDAGCSDSEERRSVVQTSLSLSYVFAQLGNYFVYLLILYSSYVSVIPLKLAEKALLPLMTLLSCLGSPSATYDSVVFLSQWLHLPASVLDVYVETSAVTRFGQVMVSVSGFFFITLVVPLIYFRKVRFRPGRFLGGLSIGVVLCAVIAGGAIALRGTLFPPAGSRYATLQLDPRLTDGVKWSIADAGRALPETTADPAFTTSSIASIRQRGVLRVGFNPQIIPFSYRNARGELVGFDISYAYRLARDLGVSIEFVPFVWRELSNDLLGHRFDVAMSGIYETNERIQTLLMSDPYFVTPLAVIVPSGRATIFLDGEGELSRPGLRLAVFDDPVLVPLSRRLFPKAQIVVLPDYNNLPSIMNRMDAAVWTLEQGTAWAAEHPGFTAVAPDHVYGPISTAFAMAPDSAELAGYVSRWLQLRADDGFRDEQIAYWLQLRPRVSTRSRWNLLDYLRARYGHAL